MVRPILLLWKLGQISRYLFAPWQLLMHYSAYGFQHLLLVVSYSYWACSSLGFLWFLWWVRLNKFPTLDGTRQQLLMHYSAFGFQHFLLVGTVFYWVRCFGVVPFAPSVSLYLGHLSAFNALFCFGFQHFLLVFLYFGITPGTTKGYFVPALSSPFPYSYLWYWSFLRAFNALFCLWLSAFSLWSSIIFGMLLVGWRWKVLEKHGQSVSLEKVLKSVL